MPATPPALGDGATQRQRRLWAVLAGAAMVAFGVIVVLSTGGSAVPVGASGSMAGMDMSSGADEIAVTMRDADGRTVRLPDGRPGAVVSANASDCDVCVETTRAAARAARQVPGGASLVVLMLDSVTTREQIRRFAAAVGPSPARYVVNDRNGELAMMLGTATIGRIVVHDRRGRVVGRPAVGTRALGVTLRRAAR